MDLYQYAFFEQLYTECTFNYCNTITDGSQSATKTWLPNKKYSYIGSKNQVYFWSGLGCFM